MASIADVPSTESNGQRDGAAAPASMTRDELVQGRYRVEQILRVERGETLVRGLDEPAGRPVAIRFLTAASDAPSEHRARWQSEARASRQVRSPHLAEVLDVGQTDEDVPYVVSEYVTGCPLDLMLASGTVSSDDAVGWVRHACDGLSAAHRRGLVHHDLTSRSLTVVRSDEGQAMARLLGLGTSRLLDVDARLRPEPERPLYRAPERLRAGDSNEDVSGNVWSLGVILYELLTGSLPFQGASVQAIERSVIVDRPTPPSRLRGGIPERLEEAVLGCLAKSPQDRIASPAALSRELSPFTIADDPTEEPAFDPVNAPANRNVRCSAPPILRNRRRRIVLL